VLVITIIIGVFFSATLVIHTYITGNAVEKNCTDLKAALEKYYSKEAKALEEAANELKAEELKKEKETLKVV